MESGTTPGEVIATTSLRPFPDELSGRRRISVWSISVCVVGIFSTIVAFGDTSTVAVAFASANETGRLIGTVERTLTAKTFVRNPVATTRSE